MSETDWIRVRDQVREVLDERGVEWEGVTLKPGTTWASGKYRSSKIEPCGRGMLKVTLFGLTPEEAVSSVLGDDDYEYERKMDALLCALTNGKLSKSRAYELDFMVQFVNEELEAEMAADGECEQILTDCDDGLMPPFTAHCSKCGAGWGFTPKFCHECGAKVIGTRDERKAVTR